MRGLIGMAAAAGLALAGPSGAQAGRSGVRLVSWNIEHLAEHDGEGCRPRSEADYRAIRSFVDASFDSRTVIAFQEVQNAAAAGRVFPAAKFRIVMVDQPYPPPSDRCGGSGSGGLRLPQRVGFAVGRDVPFTRNPDLDALNTSNGYPLREGADITIQTAHGPVRLLAVHLKSGCADTTARGAGCSQLFAQIAPLETWIEARARAAQPFAILGNFNRLLALPDATFWNEVDDGSPRLDLKIAVRDLAPGTVQTCPPHAGTPFIDHLVLSTSVAARYVAGSFRQLPTTISDHCPVELKLQ